MRHSSARKWQKAWTQMQDRIEARIAQLQQEKADIAQAVRMRIAEIDGSIHALREVLVGMNGQPHEQPSPFFGESHVQQ